MSSILENEKGAIDRSALSEGEDQVLSGDENKTRVWGDRAAPTTKNRRGVHAEVAGGAREER